MRIGLIGQAAFGEAGFRALRDAGEEIVAVSSITGTAERPDALWAAADAAGIERFPTGKLRRANVLEAYGATRPDLCVMAFVTHILPERVLTAPPLGTIQYHPSLLPRHRGISSMHWAIRQGETKTGLTVFWVDAGIDTGPILLQKEVDIGADDTVGSLYFDKLFQPGVDALVEAVRLVHEGKAPRIAQNASQATYEPAADDANSRIDWSRPGREVYNLIRGSNPAPGAHATLSATGIRIFDARLTLLDAPEAVPGTTLAVTESSIDIAVVGAVLHVHRAQRIGGKKLPAAAFAAEMGLVVGEAFENGQDSAK